MIKNNPLNQFIFVSAALVIIFAGIKMSSVIVVPFLLSLFIAIVCSPIIKFMTKRNIPHWLAIALLFLLILLIFFFLVGLINGSVQEFTKSMPQYRELMTERINDFQSFTRKWKIPFSMRPDAVVKYFDPSSIMNFASSLLMNFSNVVSNVFVLILVVVFMLLEAPTAKRKFAIVFGQHNNQESEEENHLERVLESIISYLGIKTMVSLLTAVAIWVVLTIADVQYAILWATLSFLFNYIPNIGSIIAAIPIVVQTMLLNGFTVGFVVAISVIIINMVIGNVLEPRLMGRKLGLSTLVVFLSLLFWGWILGTVGMLLSVPLTMALKIALESSPRTERYAILLSDRLPKKSELPGS
ncbi:AI-2E family transporter [Lonepinella sp. BR2930]|uniref:AI-2E family transporter n=1 Tax=Lonepinella sp. BR2930 TaxID=3434554 RepID=UPI003F6DFB4D